MGYQRLYVRITPVGGPCGRYEIRHACKNVRPIVDRQFHTRAEAERFLFDDTARLNQVEHLNYNIIND